MKKKLLLLGNKHIDNVSKEMINTINSFDIIMRINKMDNLMETGCRVDWWWFDHCIRHHIKKFTTRNYLKNVSKVMTNWTSICLLGLNNANSTEENKLNQLRVFFPELPDHCDVIKNKNYLNCSICERNKYWNISDKNKTVPTTFIIALSHLIDEYSDEYDIYIACTDLEGRDKLYKSNPEWSGTWHYNVGQHEEDYLKLMIKEGKIKYLDVENHNKIITKTFITAKGTSVRCPNKNIKLLPYVLEQCRSYLNITVITDNLSIKKICDKYNVNCFLEPIEAQKGEFNSIYNYLVQTNQLDTIKEFILLPLTQPIRNNETIMNVAYSDLTDYDFATTYSIVPNRKIFLLNDDFTYQYDSYERKGSLCKDSKMIDGYIYKIKTDCLIRIINSENVNHEFWNNSKIKFVENTTGIFLDIDEPRDLKMFEIYKEIYK